MYRSVCLLNSSAASHLKPLEDTGVPNENDVYHFQTGYNVHCLSAHMGVTLHRAALYFVTRMPFVPSSVLSTQSTNCFFCIFTPFLGSGQIIQFYLVNFVEWIICTYSIPTRRNLFFSEEPTWSRQMNV